MFDWQPAEYLIMRSDLVGLPLGWERQIGEVWDIWAIEWVGDPLDRVPGGGAAGFLLTHLPTGRRIGGPWPSRSAIEHFLAESAALVDWDVQTGIPLPAPVIDTLRALRAEAYRRFPVVEPYPLARPEEPGA